MGNTLTKALTIAKDLLETKLPSILTTLTPKATTLLVASFYVTNTLYHHLWKQYQHRQALKLRSAVYKRHEQQFRSLKLADVDGDKQQRIISATVGQLVDGLNEGVWTSYELVSVFIRRCGLMGREMGLVADHNYGPAIEMAKKCDSERRGLMEHGKLPALYGVPVSVKDHVRVKGLASSYGFIRQMGFVNESDGPLTVVLKKAGAIIFVKSNLCVFGMDAESCSGAWGRALNPWNRDRTTGGSSGGEGGLVAAGLSPLGLGTDIGGSIRIPAAFCGIYGLKPSNIRTSESDVNTFGFSDRDGMGSKIALTTCSGPMGKCVEDLATTMRVMYSPEYFDEDYTVAQVPFKENEYQSDKQLCIGYFTTDTYYYSCPSMIRAVNITRKVLEEKGYKVIPFDYPHDLFRALTDTFTKLAFVSREKVKATVENAREILPEYTSIRAQKFSVCQLKILYHILRIFKLRSPAQLTPLKNAENTTTAGLIGLNASMKYYSQKFVERMKEQGIDLLLFPSMPIVAAPHTAFSKDLISFVSFTGICNVMQLPAGVVPITEVQEHEQFYAQKAQTHLEKKANIAMADSKGMPVSIQIAGKPFDDEKILRVMKDVQDSVKFKLLTDRQAEEIHSSNFLPLSDSKKLN